MIVIEKIDGRYKTYSNAGLMIRPVADRLGKPINQNTVYDEAIDIEVAGRPRFDYQETDEIVELELSIEEE